MSGSTKTGLRLLCKMDKIVAMYVLDGTITSDCSLKLNAFNANVNASRPEATPIQ